MAFRLNYRISRTTTLQPDEIIRRTQSVLSEKKYRVTDVTAKTVVFYRSPWRLESRGAPVTVDGGIFNINFSDNDSTIVLDSYVSLLPQLLVLMALTCYLVANSQYDAIIFFGVFYLFAGAIYIVTTRAKARELLDEILNLDTID